MVVVPAQLWSHDVSSRIKTETPPPHKKKKKKKNEEEGMYAFHYKIQYRRKFPFPVVTD